MRRDELLLETAKTILVQLYPEVDDAGRPYLPYAESLETIVRLSAALSEQTQPVRVKALEWEKTLDRYRGSERREQWMAKTPWGGFYIWHYQFDYDEVARGQKFTVGSHQTPFEPTGIEYDTLEAAKAAAQQDYETRIRSALQENAGVGSATDTKGISDE